MTFTWARRHAYYAAQRRALGLDNIILRYEDIPVPDARRTGPPRFRNLRIDNSKPKHKDRRLNPFKVC